MTMHEEFTDKLSDYLDDELTPEERRLVDAHLSACTDCARTLRDLAEVAAAAASLPVREPPRDLWNGIANRISAAPRAVAPSRRRFAFTLPQLAAAVVVLAALSGWVAVRLLPPASPPPATATLQPASGGAAAPPFVPVSVADQQYDQAVADLQEALKRGRDRLDPETVAVLERNLRVIDEAVEDAQKALGADPANAFLGGYLVERRQRKLELLRTAAALAQGDEM
jgi:anti-sigma factor RsiW